MTTTIADIARTIADTHTVTYDEALTTATAYAIQCEVPGIGVQEGGQAPDVEVNADDAEFIVEAFAVAVSA